MRIVAIPDGRRRGASGPPASLGRGEAGDTLLEVLIAIVVISIVVVGLLGALVTSITSSGEHRNLATIDSLLKSFAETSKYQIQQQPNPIFSQCAKSYLVVGSPSPTNGPVNTAVTILGSGFNANKQLNVTIGGKSINGAGTSSSNGDGVVTFQVPASLAPGTYPVTVSEQNGNNSAVSTTGFTVAPAGTPITVSPLAKYSFTTAVQYWDPSASPPAFDGSCGKSGIQQVTLTATAPNSISDNLSVVVINPTYVYTSPPAPVGVASPATSAGQKLTFTATITPPFSGTPAPTGTVSWSATFNGGAVSVNCPSNLTPSTGNTAAATCVVTNSAQVGTYTATATYSGDSNYASSSSTGSLTVSTAPPAGSDIQGLPSPRDGVPDSGDQIAYSYSQVMSASSIKAGWNGSATAVTAQFTRVSGSSTVLTICTSPGCGTAVNLGSVDLGDPSGNRYVNGGSTVNLPATMSMANGGGQSVVTVTLTSSSPNITALSPSNTSTTMTWTPSAGATNVGGTSCITAAVTESTSPKRNF